MKLERSRVIRAALGLLDEAGIDGLTTRRLAKELGVQSPALYWHFENKQALLDALAAAMLEEGHTCRVPAPGQGWREFLLDNARSFRRALLSRRDGARLHAGARPDAGQLPGVEAQVQHLCDAGFSPADAVRAGILVGRFVVGWVLEEQAGPGAESEGAEALEKLCDGHPHLAAGLRGLREGGPDDSFEFGLGVILDGLAARLAGPG